MAPGNDIQNHIVLNLPASASGLSKPVRATLGMNRITYQLPAHSASGSWGLPVVIAEAPLSALDFAGRKFAWTTPHLYPPVDSELTAHRGNLSAMNSISGAWNRCLRPRQEGWAAMLVSAWWHRRLRRSGSGRRRRPWIRCCVDRVSRASNAG